MMLRTTKTQAVLGFTVALSCGIALAVKGCEWYMLPHGSPEATKGPSKIEKTKDDQCVFVPDEADLCAESDTISENSSSNIISDIGSGRLWNGKIPIGSVQKLQEAFEEEDRTKECIRTRYQEFVSSVKPGQSHSSSVLLKASTKITVHYEKAFEGAKKRLEVDLPESLLDTQGSSYSLETEKESPLSVSAPDAAKLCPQPMTSHSDLMTNVTYSDSALPLPTEPILLKMDSTASVRFQENPSSFNNVAAKSPTSTTPVESHKTVEKEKEETGTEAPNQFARLDWTEAWRVIEEFTVARSKLEPSNASSSTQSCNAQTYVANESTEGKHASRSTSPVARREVSSQRRNGKEDKWAEYNRSLAHRILDSTLRELGTDRIE